MLLISATGCEAVALDFTSSQAALECLVVDQDCEDDAKCTLSVAGERSSPSCVKNNGLPALPVGSACELSPSGVDPCVQGALCSSAGPLPLVPSQGVIPKSDADAGKRCRQFCDADASCADGQYCYALQGLRGTAGICIDTCEVSRDACPYAFQCTLVRTVGDGWIGACMSPGELKLGDVCDAANRCEQDLLCSGDATSPGSCQPLCDEDKDCSENYFCQEFTTLTEQKLAACRADID